MLGAQVGDEAGDFVVRKCVREGRHFFATHDELIFNFFRGPHLAEVARESRTFFCADSACAVAVFTTFFAEKVGAGLLSWFGGGRNGCGRDQGDEGNEKESE